MILLRRACAVIASVFLIAAIAIGTLTDPMLPLGRALEWVDGLPEAAGWVRENGPAWLWNWVLLPVLGRPAWLLPAGVGIVAGGLSMTLPEPGGKRKVRRS